MWLVASSCRTCLVFVQSVQRICVGFKTLLTGFSVLLTAGSGALCLPFLDGVRLILGEWNLSISFMVNVEM